MCEFCESLIDNSKEVEWKFRSTFADDNICEVIVENDCSKCYGCTAEFKLSGYESDGNVFVSVNYLQQLNNRDNDGVIINPFSESMQWNYCPVCGNKISKDIINWNKDYYYGIKISKN